MEKQDSYLSLGQVAVQKGDLNSTWKTSTYASMILLNISMLVKISLLLELSMV